MQGQRATLDAILRDASTSLDKESPIGLELID